MQLRWNILNMQLMAGERNYHFCDLRWHIVFFFWWHIVEDLNPSRTKESMNEEATTVQAKQPPSSLLMLFFRFCFL